MKHEEYDLEKIMKKRPEVFMEIPLPDLDGQILSSSACSIMGCERPAIVGIYREDNSGNPGGFIGYQFCRNCSYNFTYDEERGVVIPRRTSSNRPLKGNSSSDNVLLTGIPVPSPVSQPG